MNFDLTLLKWNLAFFSSIYNILEDIGLEEVPWLNIYAALYRICSGTEIMGGIAATISVN